MFIQADVLSVARSTVKSGVVKTCYYFRYQLKK